MRTQRTVSIVLMLGMATSFGCRAGGTSERAGIEPAKTVARPAAPALPEQRAHLPAPAREILWERMQGHGSDMTLLLWAVLFLDYDGATEISRSIVAEPRLARPISNDDSTINALLPEKFFVLQDELTLRAKRIAELASAPARDGAAIARAYGELAATCVKCHSEYLTEPPSRDGALVLEGKQVEP